METKTATLLGCVRLSSITFLLALLPTALLPLLVSIPVYNDYQPDLWIPFAVMAGGAFVLLLLPAPSSVLFASLLIGGVVANVFFASLAAVPDYIPMPWDHNHFFNVADVFIVASFLTLPWVVRNLWLRYWR